jgi:predicted Zn-dependent peptidase
MADLVLHPLFDEKEIVKERGVILEEIKMVEDTPDELAQELFVSTLWKGHPLGRPIAGYRKTVKKIDKKILTSFYRRYFRAGNMILTAAGHLNHDRVAELSRKHLSAIKNGSRRAQDTPPEPRGRITLKNNKELNQLNICLGLPAFGQNHKDRHACHLLNAILGGTMSSRLLQKIREEMGLAYAVFSYLVSHKNAGYLMIYAGTGKKTGNRVVNLITSEMTKLKKEPVAIAELDLVKDFVKGVIFLGLESTISRMAYLAKREIYHGTYESLDALRKSIDAVTREDILRVAEALFHGDALNMIVLGDLSRFRRPASLALG